MTEPLISVIIVVYNSGNSLEAAINSVLGQSFSNRELVIIDGGSTDQTNQVINGYRSQIGYYISEPDNGIYDAMNKGIAAAKGEWLYFLGSDDELLDKDTLSAVFNDPASFKETSFIFGNVLLRSNRRSIGGDRDQEKLIAANIPHQAIFYNKAIFKELGGYNTNFPILADWEMNLRIFSRPQIKKLFVNRNIALFNDKGGASNIKIDSRFFESRLEHFLQVDKRPANDPALQPYYFYNGIICLCSKRKLQGLRYSLRSFTSGSKKIYFMLMFCKFMLGFMGAGKKIKII